MTKVGVGAIDKSTTLESNKSLTDNSSLSDIPPAEPRLRL
jgi:hypothetical protein